MSQWFLANYIQCLRCKGAQRMATGYKPIPNPILFDSEAQSRNYHTQQRLSANYVGIDVTQKCEQCSQLHSQWNVLNHQQFIDLKAKLAKGGVVRAKSPRKVVDAATEEQ